MIPNSFDQINKADIGALINNAVGESKTLDYKLTLFGNTDGDKKEFLKDVSSLANAAGGDILYGIDEIRDKDGHPTGIPKEAKGLSGINVDKEILRLDSLARTGIAPRISGLQIKPILGFPDGPILLIRIPKSWAAPHMIVFQSESRFWSRTNNGKYPLDISEIRSAFALSDAIPERVRRFRDGRLARIIADETPVPLIPLPKTVIHVLPIQSLDPAFTINIADVEREPIIPISVSGANFRYNFDGFVTYNSRLNQQSGSYIQFFRNGAIEAVTIYLLHERNDKGVGEIPSVKFEREIIKSLVTYLTLERKWSVMPPYFVMISMIDVKGFVVSHPNDSFSDRYPIDQDVLLLPDVLVNNEDAYSNIDIASTLKPVFDTLWQASGLARSLNYDENGNWRDTSR